MSFLTLYFIAAGVDLVLFLLSAKIAKEVVKIGDVLVGLCVSFFPVINIAAAMFLTAFNIKLLASTNAVIFDFRDPKVKAQEMASQARLDDR